MPLRVCLLIFLLGACAVVRAPEHTRIALFAPFEGRYREIGYNALYAARLAIADYSADYSGVNVDLLPVDSGGTEAVNHAKALAQDPLIMAAIVLGYDGTSSDVLRAFGDIPVLVVGDWGARRVTDSIFILSNSKLDSQLTVSPRISMTDAANQAAPAVGGDVFALQGFAKLRSSLDEVAVLSSGFLPDTEFKIRYKENDPFAPPPGLLATLTYHTATIASRAVQTGSRNDAHDWIASADYEGFNGAIRFEHGYWLDAPIHHYRYIDGSLTEDIVK